MKKYENGIEFELNDKIVLKNGETVTFKEKCIMWGMNVFITKEDRGKDSYLLVSDINEEKTIALNTIKLFNYVTEEIANLYLAKRLLEIWINQGIDKIFKSSYRIKYYRDEKFHPIEMFYDVSQRVFYMMEDLKDKKDSRLDDVMYMDKDCKTRDQLNFVKKYYSETLIILKELENHTNLTKLQSKIINRISSELEFIQEKYKW